MYTAHYNLKSKPFQISSDAGFIWLGEKHKEALATLRYGILDNKGFLLLTGDVGTGKTTLINALIASLSEDVIYASVPDPSLNKMDFFNYIAAAFGIGGEFLSKGKFLSSFSDFLHKAYDGNRKVLLIIDECQLMTQELLEEIRLLSNIVTKDSSPLLNIFFVGQYEFNEIIRRPENRAVAQRLTLNYYIEPLTAEETGAYIQHRLKIAGTTERIFNIAAVKAIYDYSGGFPRKINIICDHCLMCGYAEDQKTITSAIVRESVKDLQLPERKKERKRENTVAANQSEPLIPVALKEPQQSPRFRPPPNQFVQIDRQDRAPKTSFSWSTNVILLIVLVLISFGFVFLYFSNTSYQEAMAYFSSFGEKMQRSAPLPPESSVHQKIRDNSVPQDDNKKSGGLPVPANSENIISKNSLADGTAGSLALNNKTPMDPAVPGEVDSGNAELSSMDEQKVTPVNPQPVPKQPMNNTPDPVIDSTGVTPENSSPPLPKETLVIRFKYDSNLFSVDDIERMKEFAGIVSSHPEATVNVIGYTDSIGDEGYNKKLSEFRANMVKSFLMGQNLPPEKIRTQGLGDKNPVERNDTPQGRTMNRRVEISVDVVR